MRIRNGMVGQIPKVYGRNEAGGQELGDRRAVKRDGVDVSEKARLLSDSVQGAVKVSESRAMKIESLRQQVRSGTYQVDATTLAERILAQRKFARGE